MGLVLLLVVEAPRRTQEAWWEHHELALRRRGVVRGLTLEIVLYDGLDASDVVQLEVHRSPAGGVEPLAAILVAQAKKLLRLA